MGFLAWIRKIQHALHECAESIHHSEERKGDKQLPLDKPIEVRAVVSFSDETVRNAEAQAQRQHATQESIKNATWTATVAVAVYALITLGVWGQMIKQNRIASAVLRQSTETFRIDERAWLELEPFKSERVEISSALKQAIPDAKGSGQQVFIKNYGRTIARSITTRMSLVTADGSFGDDPPRIRDVQDALRLGKNTSSDKNKWVLIYPQLTPASIAPGVTTNTPIHLGGIEPYTTIDGKTMFNYNVGRIDYIDAFGVAHWKTFCFSIAKNATVAACNSGNDEDGNPELPPN